MFDRLVGLETEYALRFHPHLPDGRRVPNSELFARLVQRLKSRLPVVSAIVAQHGWFLANGGGLKFEYLPFYEPLPAAGLVEGASPECRGPRDLLRYSRAQDILLSREIAASGAADGEAALL